jgi:hypothetical protein
MDPVFGVLDGGGDLVGGTGGGGGGWIERQNDEGDGYQSQGPGVLETNCYRNSFIEIILRPFTRLAHLATRVKSFETRPKTFISKGTQGLLASKVPIFLYD